jgi:hypothetical protein
VAFILTSREATNVGHNSGTSSDDDDRRNLRQKRNAVRERTSDNDILLCRACLMPRVLHQSARAAARIHGLPHARGRGRAELGIAAMMMMDL